MSWLPFISLTTPAMLGGLALLTLPVLAHVLNRHSRRRVVFPTIRLLRQSVASQSRLFRLRRWILLALRCLLVALLVAAFARPIWFDASAAAALNQDRTNSVVVLLDSSASTRQDSQGVHAFHTLRSRANQALDSLVSGTDMANIIVATGHPRAMMPGVTRNLPALRSELSTLEPTFERADFLQAMSLAGEALEQASGQRRLLILSDLQQSNWDDLLKQKESAKLLPSGTNVTIVAPDKPAPPNVGLSQPRYFPSQPLSDQPVQLIVRATNYSEQPKQARVILHVDGQPANEQTVTLAPREQRDVPFDSVKVTSGEHRVEFSTSEDACPFDDRAYLVFRTVNRLPVLVVSDDNPRDMGSATYFLVRALAPHDDALDRFEVRHLSTSQVTAAELAKSTAVFVGYISEMTPPIAGLLRQHVEHGGGMMIFCGEGAVVRNLQALDAGATPLLPWQPGAARGSGLLNEALRITGGKWQSRLLSDFDEQSQISMAQIRFQRTWAAGALRPESQILLTFSDGTPALGVLPVGLGQVLLANFSPALETSDLAKYGSFVALVQSLAKQLRPAQAAVKPVFVGEAYRYSESLSGGAQVGGISLRGPDGKEQPYTTSVDSGRLHLDIPRVEKAGIYQFQRGTSLLATVAINVDPRESDLERVDSSKLSGHFSSTGIASQVQQSDGWNPMISPGGQPIWGSCMAAAMCVIALEMLLVGLWRR